VSEPPLLSVVKGNAAGRELAVHGELLLGRESDPPGDLGGDQTLSGEHASVTATRNGDLVVTDLDSTNGTFVNGDRITGTRVLQPGDELQVGRSVLVVGGVPAWEDTAVEQDAWRDEVAFRGDVTADRGGVVAGKVEGGIRIGDDVKAYLDPISGATGLAKALIAVGLLVAVTGFVLFAFPIIMALSEGFSNDSGPSNPPDLSPWLPLGFGLIVVGGVIGQIGVFLKK
jgi:hypothetical protein